jgi:hypothetical protein
LAVFYIYNSFYQDVVGACPSLTLHEELIYEIIKVNKDGLKYGRLNQGRILPFKALSNYPIKGINRCSYCFTGFIL